MTQNTYDNLFQISYVTTDLEQAIAHFRQSQGVNEFLNLGQISLEVVSGDTAEMKVALSFVGSIMIEIIEPVSGAVELFCKHLSGKQFELRLHHLGYRAYSTSELDALAEAHRTMGHPIVNKGQFGTVASFFVLILFPNLDIIRNICFSRSKVRNS